MNLDVVVLIPTIIITIILTWYTSRQVFLKRLKLLKEMTQNMSQGNFSGRINIYSPDEVGDVARGLNEVSQEFQKRIRDITHDKERFEAILSSMVEGVIVISSQGRLEHVSPNFRKMLELRSPASTGKLYWEVIWNQEINDTIKEALIHKKAFNKEIHIFGTNENIFSMQISPVIDQKQDLISLVAVFHDITELKKLEKMRSEFVANVSHELKTPLTSIKGFIETLKTCMKDDPSASERFLEIIAKQTRRLENLVNDLLILSSIESQEVKMDLAADSLDRLIGSVVQICKPQFDVRSQDLMINISENLPIVLIDRQRIEQVFLNLIDNAIKFTPEHGKITIEASTHGDFVRVDVKDTGIGIAAEHIPRLFERFYRVDRARSRETGGTGLGLSIVKHIVNAHQGKLSVVSSPGKGSTFSVYLPRIINPHA